MTLTLLLDLDDTLLDSNMEAFIPAYFQALASHLSNLVSPEVMLPALMAGTRRMMASEDPAYTLRQVFDAEFFPKLGIERQALEASIEEFYDEVFPRLETFTRPRPQAVELVEWAFSRGYRVAIATDPLFPLKATHHRLRFAGLLPEKYPFALVSSYETFHFTKSHAAYFAEVLGRLGWPEGPVLMVGNDAERDLAPANRLGLATFWVNGELPQSSDPAANGRGSLAHLKEWLSSVDFKSLEPRFKTPDSCLALLMATPAVAASLAAQFPASSWTRRPAPAEWALTEILCHLRDTERELTQARLQTILKESDPFIASRNTDAWADERHYLQQDGETALKEFVAARKETLHILKGLSAAEWERKARHSIFGPTTLLEMMLFTAEHDRLHVQQIWHLLHPA